MKPVERKKSHNGIITTVILWSLLIIFIIPFVIMLISAFKTNAEIMGNPLAISKNPTLINFIDAFTAMNYPVALFNTFIITLISVALIVLTSAMVAYYVLRSKSKIGKIIFYMFTSSMMIPFQAIMIPLVTIYGHLGLLSNRMTLIYLYIGFGCSQGMFIFHGFMKSSIPISIEESAKIDGANVKQIFFGIVFPLLKPIIATLAVLDVLWIWNDFMLPSLVLTKPFQLTLPLSNYSFSGQMSVNFGPLIASLVMTIIPVLVLYIFLQKYIIEGITSGAVKS